MYVCTCNGITEREIRGAADLGCRTLEDLNRELGVAGCCGKCAEHAHRVLEACALPCAGCPRAGACPGGHD